MVRVTHPHYPLYNQIVKVLRRAGHPVYREACYLIELPDGTRAELPEAWMEEVTEESQGGQEVTVEWSPQLWAGISEFLTLAAVLKALSSSIVEEASDGKRNGPAGTDPGNGSAAAARTGPAGPAGGAP